MRSWSTTWMIIDEQETISRIADHIRIRDCLSHVRFDNANFAGSSLISGLLESEESSLPT